MEIAKPIGCKAHHAGEDHCHDSPEIAVWKNEEKKTDVSLGAHLINDAWLDLYEQAVVITNDTDQEEAIKLARTDYSDAGGRIAKTIGVITPTTWGREPAGSLTELASWSKAIRSSHLENAQLPDTIPTSNAKTLYRPPLWR